MGRPKKEGYEALTLAESFLTLYELLELMPCPKCSRPCLEIEYVTKSGIQMSCNGYDPMGEDGACSYRDFALVTPTSRLPTT
jgi:hypothetical protein